MKRTLVFLSSLAFALGLLFLFLSIRPAGADPLAVTPLPPVEETDGRAGSCYSNYYEHGNRPFLPLVHAAGVRHDRVDFRWAVIEPENDSWNFWPYDELVVDVLAEGIDLVAILQWTPEWAAATGQTTGVLDPPRRPPGWYAPVVRELSGGASSARSSWSAVPAGLYLPWDHPDNHWGDFVFQTVSRYVGVVNVWEMWNEPDGDWGAWDGSAADYAQLLKVGYQAARAADPNATILFGGLMYWADPTFFERVLDVVNDDPAAPGHNYFFDVMSVHFYSRSSDVYDMVNHVRQRMKIYVPDHPIWLTETGVPVYDGAYPGVRTDFSATEAEAAAYLIQSYANAIAADVGRYHWFRAHDGDMAEHFGLTHDENYLRPAYVAYQVATTYLISPTFVTRAVVGPHVNVTLWGTPHGRVSVVWNESPVTGVYTLPAVMPTATLVERWGATRTVAASNGVTGTFVYGAYTFTLPAATASRVTDPDDYIIGGDPLIVVETEAPNAPPTSTVRPLPEVTHSPVFTVAWEGSDAQSGVWFYDVQVRDGSDGRWEDWLSTSAVSHSFVGRDGHTYHFRSRATDRVGNREDWPAESQAHTRLILSGTLHVNIGAFFADENRNDHWDRPITGTNTVTWTEEITLTQVALRFRDATGRDVISPSVGSAWEFTATISLSKSYHLWAASADRRYVRVLPLALSGGEGVYTRTYEALGLWPARRLHLPLVFRQG